MKNAKRIALALPLGVPHLEQVVHGIRLYGQQRGDWEFVTSPETHSIPVSSLEGWNGDGVLGMVNTREDLRVVRNLRCPAVNLSGAMQDPGLPRVRVDYEAAGGMGADHLLSRGFQNFAYYGLKGIFYAQLCGQGFSRQIQKNGRRCSIYEDHSTATMSKPWQHQEEELEEWLRSLHLPVGIMASHDPRGVMLTQACQRLGLKVPGEVAIIGFNNDIQSCEFCTPTLSSIARNGEKIGWEAAQLLDGLMNGRPAPKQDVIVEPGAVVERASTDTVGVSDPELSAALRFIHDNISKPIGVDDILRTISMSRRWLEYAFQKNLRTTPIAYIAQLRVKRARSLLGASNKLKLKQVAVDCGFRDTRHLNVVFQRVTGVSPREFRKQPITGL
ncbi:MAG TPA: DNA-binding transcriptional regulator [Methylomirabilota bacterium]|nr:DNA-binding transcriptional regulator [Methylomirabilota bacterium]